MKRQHGRQVRATVQAHVVRRAAAPSPTAAPTGTAAPTTAPAAPITSPARPTTAPTQTHQAEHSEQANRAVAEGVQHHRAGRLAEAEAHYRQALAVESSHPEALHLL